MERFDRQILLFGEEGQEKLAAATVAIVGVGGLGSHVVQQLAYLGIRRFLLVDGERVVICEPAHGRAAGIESGT